MVLSDISIPKRIKLTGVRIFSSRKTHIWKFAIVIMVLSDISIPKRIKLTGVRIFSSRKTHMLRMLVRMPNTHIMRLMYG